MERVYDKYHSYMVQGDCYKYIHKCPNCGKIIFEIKDKIIEVLSWRGKV